MLYAASPMCFCTVHVEPWPLPWHYTEAPHIRSLALRGALAEGPLFAEDAA